MSIIVPSFNGEFIFGADVVMVTSDPPRDVQVNAFIGINGVEVIDLGRRARYTMVTGRFIGVDEYGLGAIENYFRSYNDGYAYTLITTDGLVWPDVKLESFEPQPPMRLDRFTGEVSRAYRARLMHLR